MTWVISIAAGNLLCAALYYLTLRTRLFRIPQGARSVVRPALTLFGPALLGSGLGGGLAPGLAWLIGAASVVPAFVVIPFTLLLGGAVAALPRNERPNFYGIIISGIIIALLIGLLGGWLGGVTREIFWPRLGIMIQYSATTNAR